MNTFLLFPEGKEKALTLSYDDGVDTDIRFIELMEKYNIKCTFNINSGLFSPEGSVRAEGQVHFRLPESEVKKLYDHPLCEVATHSVSHPVINLLPSSKCMLEIVNDRQNLEKMFGRIVRGHAYPYGAYSEETAEILRQAGIAYARTVAAHHSFKLPNDWLRLETTCHHASPELMRLADSFINGEVGNRDGWLFYLWGHTYEFRQMNNWHIIEEFFEKVSGNGNVWYATNIEVYEYITAYRSLVYSADATTVYNPTCTDVWVKIDAKKIHVPAGKTVSVNQ